MESGDIEAHPADIAAAELEPHGEIGDVTEKVVLLGIALEEFRLGQKVVVRVVLLILIVKIRRILPPVCRLGHSRRNSNEVLIALGQLVPFIQPSFPLRCQKVVISLTVALYLLAVLIILVSVTAGRRIFLPQVARLAGPALLVVGHTTCTVLLSGDLVLLVHQVDIFRINGDLLLIEHGHRTVWALVAHVRFGLDLKRVAPAPSYIL